MVQGRAHFARRAECCRAGGCQALWPLCTPERAPALHSSTSPLAVVPRLHRTPSTNTHTHVKYSIISVGWIYLIAKSELCRYYKVQCLGSLFTAMFSIYSDINLFLDLNNERKKKKLKFTWDHSDVYHCWLQVRVHGSLESGRGWPLHWVKSVVIRQRPLNTTHTTGRERRPSPHCALHSPHGPGRYIYCMDFLYLGDFIGIVSCENYKNKAYHWRMNSSVPLKSTDISRYAKSALF